MHRKRSELDPEWLLTAYANGLFPMADDVGDVMWFCPDPRAILPLDDFHVSETLGRVCRSRRFDVEFDHDFSGVIRACADRAEGTWISEEFIESYAMLHKMGFAHSVEAWREGVMVGGLYGVSMGGVFFGESMFHRDRDASKVALVYLVERMRARGFTLLDIQFMTAHLKRFGAVEIPRVEYLRRLKIALRLSCRLAD